MKLFSKKGFGLLEVVLSISIIAVSLFAVSGTIRASAELNRRSLYATRAGFLIGEATEGIRFMRDKNWSNISGFTTGTPYYISFGSGGWQATTTKTLIDGIFIRNFSLSEVYRDGSDKIAPSGTLDTGTRFVNVTVSWWNGLSTSSRSSFFYISDIAS